MRAPGHFVCNFAGHRAVSQVVGGAAGMRLRGLENKNIQLARARNQGRAYALELQRCTTFG
jgi:hypothetical protein